MSVTFETETEFLKELVAKDPNLKLSNTGPTLGYVSDWVIPDGDGPLELLDLKIRLRSKIVPKIREFKGVNISYELFEQGALRAKFPECFDGKACETT